MHKLQFVDGSRDSVWLVEPKVTIGKNAANDVVLSSPGLTDFHAEIRVDNDNLYLINLNARNICKVNGKLVPTSAPLRTNDVIEFDQITLKVIDPKNEPKASRPAASANAPLSDSEAWYLEGNASWMTQKTFPLKGSMTIGRDAECGLSFPVSHLSRRHAQLTVREDHIDVKDLESTNGTFINGERVTEGKARPGDKLRLDVVTFVVHGPQAKAEAPAKAAFQDDGNKTVLRRAPPKPAAAESGSAPADAPMKPRAARPVPNLMTAASKPAPKLSSQTAGKKSHWPLIAGAIVLVLVALSVLFLLK